MTHRPDSRRGRPAAAVSIATPAAAAAESAPTGVRLAATAFAVSAVTFALYMASLAPGLTWAHFGADGGELLAAAIVNGVPHPPGYPLYMLLLRGWLVALGWIAPASDIAWRGNVFSAVAAALAVALTVATVPAVLPSKSRRLLWAGIAGLALGVSPLLWSQAIITEVYALHMLFIALLGWATLSGVQRGLWWLAPPVALGAAHHLTLLLLLPAVLYYVWSEERSTRRALSAILWMGVGLAVGALLYVRIPLVARQAPPINWGFADSWQGFWWLVSGAAYRANLFATPSGAILKQIGAWATSAVPQATPFGIVLPVIGLAAWDQKQPRLRNFTLLWIIPVSIYSIGYYTRDSFIYLLPVVWLLMLCMAAGLAQVDAWLGPRWKYTAPALVLFCLVGLGGLTLWNWPTVALRGDHEARDFLRGAAEVLEPNSIVISRNDSETFALWYGTWADRSLSTAAPGLIPVNDALYQFDWYKRLQQELYPDLAGAGVSVEALLDANAALRPVYLAEKLPIVPDYTLHETPPLWRYLPGE